MTDNLPDAAYDLPDDLDDLPDLDIDDIPEGWEAPPDVPDYDATHNPEIDTAVRLPTDLAFIHRPTKRLYADWRANPDAYRHLEIMPQEGESLHGVISGRYALAELVPALIERTGQNIDDLTVATLGFSVPNGVDLFALLDGGHVRDVLFVCSHYFKSTSEPIYDAIVPHLIARGHRVLSMRNHAKLILAKMEDGTCYSCESSANYRSCINTETFTLTRDATLYHFHRKWLEHVFSLSMPGKYREQVNGSTRWK